MPRNYDQQRPKRQPPVVPLAALRKSHGLTQPEVLARVKDATGRAYTVGALSALEKGHRGGSEQFLEDIAGVFGLEAVELWTDYAPRAQVTPLDHEAVA
jgi:transcriptional regulator with XRE-family HTH domain